MSGTIERPPMGNIAEMSHIKPPSFDQQIFEDFIEFAKYRVFTKDSIESERRVETVNLDQLFGTTQSLYAGDSLGYVFRNRLKRRQDNLDEAWDNPDYFYETEAKSDMSIIAVGDRLFIELGKHRALCLKYLAHYHNDLFPDGAIVAGVELKQLVEVADFTEAMEEFSDVLEANRSIVIDFPRTFSGLNNGMPILRNFERDKHHQFSSVEEFMNCMKALSKTNWFKKELGLGWHRLF